MIGRWLRNIEPMECELWTWEWTSTYDGVPKLQELQESFEKDFPVTCERLRQTGKRYWLWPLVSFNSAEGRRFRYLVGSTSEKQDELKGRWNLCGVPQQAWIYGAADLLLRERSCNGCALFYVLDGGIFSSTIFYEGRLCFWLEESGYDGAEGSAMVHRRLESLRNFIKWDSLFGRWKNFEVIEICDLGKQWKQKMLRRAARDPFWKGLNLCRSENPSFENQVKNKMLLTFLPAVLILFLLLYLNGKIGEKMPIPQDVVPPELASPPAVEPIDRVSLKENEFFGAGGVREIPANRGAGLNRCDVSLVRVQGLVAGRLLISSGKTYLKGDSLQGFVVEGIERDGARLSCAGMDFFVEVM